MAALRTKDRMIDSAVRLLRERGVHGLTVDAVLADSGAPRGSVYHHFPGGRQELLVAAARTSASYITHLIEEAAAESDPMAAIQRFAAFWRQAMLDSDFQTGCPVAALAAAGESDELLEIARTAFDAWRRDLAAAIGTTGVEAARADRLAGMVISSIEGALPMCRAYRSAEPLDLVVAELALLL